MRFYPWHIGDYATATAHLSNDEDLAYRRLLDLYYDTEKPLSADLPALARRVRCRAAIVERVLAEFFVPDDASWRHGRADAELARMQKRTQAARSNGVRGGRPSLKGKPTGLGLGSQTKPSANPAETQPKATHIPNTQYPVPNTQEAVVAETKPLKARESNNTPRPDDVSEPVWRDFLALRKTRKSPVTATVIARLRVEAERAGWKLDAVLSECVARGWQGFRADWVSGRAVTKKFDEVDYANDQGEL